MSLSEALLLDPYPLNIYIAARTDGAKGSGTINDPSTVDKFDLILSSIPANIREAEPGGVPGGWGVFFGSVGAFILDRNVIGITLPTKIQHYAVGSGLKFQNQTVEGGLASPIGNITLRDTETVVDEALVLAFLR